MNDELIKSIMEAKDIAIEKGIRANAILINERYAYVKESLIGVVSDGKEIAYHHIPAFVAGLEIKGTGTLPLDADFIIFHAKDVSPTYQQLLEENERLRKQDDKITKILEILEGDNG